MSLGTQSNVVKRLDASATGEIDDPTWRDIEEAIRRLDDVSRRIADQSLSGVAGNGNSKSMPFAPQAGKKETAKRDLGAKWLFGRWTFVHVVGLFPSCPADSSLDVCAEPKLCELFH